MSVITTRGACMAGQDVNCRAPGQDIEHHLRGDFLRVSADTFSYDAVIASHHNHNFVMDYGLGAPGDACHLNG